jgi:hypothetical protein
MNSSNQNLSLQQYFELAVFAGSLFMLIGWFTKSLLRNFKGDPGSGDGSAFDVTWRAEVNAKRRMAPVIMWTGCLAFSVGVIGLIVCKFVM